MRLNMEEQQSPDTAGGAASVETEEVGKEKPADTAAPDAAEEEDEEALPHSEILDIFEEGLARLVQDPLLCDLPIQVFVHHILYSGLHSACHSKNKPHNPSRAHDGSTEGHPNLESTESCHAGVSHRQKIRKL